jgi:hypothetical protein
MVHAWIATTVVTTENFKLRCKIVKKMIVIAGMRLTIFFDDFRGVTEVGKLSWSNVFCF